MVAGLNFNSRYEQVQLLRDSPCLADRIAASLMIDNPEMTLQEAKIQSAVAVAMYEKHLGGKQ